MKRISTSQFAFINVRALVGLCVALGGVFWGRQVLAPSRRKRRKNMAAARSPDPLVPALFDCSKIHELGIDRQENLRAGAIMIFCGEAEGGEPGEAPSSSAFSKLVQSAMAPFDVRDHGRGSDHRNRDFAQHYPVGDIHSGLIRIILP